MNIWKQTDAFYNAKSSGKFISCVMYFMAFLIKGCQYSDLDKKEQA